MAKHYLALCPKNHLDYDLTTEAGRLAWFQACGILTLNHRRHICSKFELVGWLGRYTAKIVYVARVR